MTQRRPASGPRRVARAVIAVLALLVLLIVGPAGPASAHAELESSDPADGAVLDQPPSTVTLRYSEAVSVNAQSVRVLDGRGRRVDRGDSGRGADARSVRVRLAPDLPRDNYLVAWRAVSADSHSVHGAFNFSVGVRTDLDAGPAAGQEGGGGERAWQITAAVLRIIGYAGTLVATGAAVMVAVLGPLAERRRTGAAITLGAIAGTGAAMLGVPVSAALATGNGWRSFGDGPALVQVLGDGVGTGIVLTLTGLTLLALVGGRDQPDRRLVAGGVLLPAIAMALVGHSRTTTPGWVAFGSAGVHSLAGGAWLGGLVVLVLTLRARRHAGNPVDTATVVSRFSAVATVAVAAVSVMGLVLSYLEVRSLSALTVTTYGRLLLVKVALAAVIMALGAYNHFRLVPVVVAAGGRSGSVRPVRSVGAAVAPPGALGLDAAGSPTEGAGDATAMSRLGRVIRAELVGLLAVVAVTGVLVNVTPARTAARVSRPFDATVAFGNGKVNVVVDPSRVGRNEIRLSMLDVAGRPAAAPRNVRVQLALPAQQIGPLDLIPVRTAPGRYELVGQSLSLPGRWQVTVIERAGKFAENRATVSAPVNR